MSVFIALISESYEAAKKQMEDANEPGLRRQIIDEERKQKKVTRTTHPARPVLCGALTYGLFS